MATDEGARSRWVLTLYVSGASPNSVAAVETVRKICDEQLTRQVELEVVEIHDHPELVVRDRIVAVPTLVKRLPAPLRQLVGDLGNVARVRNGLDLGPPSRGGIQGEPGADHDW